MKTEQDIISEGVKHGDSFICPACGAPGVIDLGPLQKEPQFDHSIWYNQRMKSWECWECWLK